MANEKIWNKALTKAGKKALQYCQKHGATQEFTDGLMEAMHAEMRVAKTSGVPEPPPTPPGHGTGKP